MDLDNFNYDFRQKTESLLVKMQQDFQQRLDDAIQSTNTNVSEIEYLRGYIDMRYVDTINIFSSLLTDYHKELIAYLKSNL